MSGTCGHPTKSGEPCPTPIALCSKCGRCLSHCEYGEGCDYDEAEVRDARRRGAKAKAEKARDSKTRTVLPEEAPAPPETLEDAVTWTSWATWAVATGTIDARTAHEIGYLTRALQRGLEKLEMDERVQELEEQLAELKRKGMEVAG